MSATVWTLIVLPLLMVMQPVAMSVQRLSMPIDGAESLPYGLLLPDRHDRRQTASLVVALHPGGPRVPYYGAMFVEQVVGPAVRTLDAIVVAPDCPTGAWSDPAAERAVLSLVTRVMAEFAVDKRRVLLVGFSMGASGAWFMSARHPRLFTGAVIAAGSPSGEPLDTLAPVPTYVIHSRMDEVVPFAPAERAVRELERLGHAVRFEPLDGPGHYDTAKYVQPIARGVRWVIARSDKAR